MRVLVMLIAWIKSLFTVQNVVVERIVQPTRIITKVIDLGKFVLHLWHAKLNPVAVVVRWTAPVVRKARVVACGGITVAHDVVRTVAIGVLAGVVHHGDKKDPVVRAELRLIDLDDWIPYDDDDIEYFDDVVAVMDEEENYDVGLSDIEVLEENLIQCGKDWRTSVTMKKKYWEGRNNNYFNNRKTQRIKEERRATKNWKLCSDG